MSKESAKEFVNTFYKNDEFLTEFVKKGGLNKNATDEEKTALLLKTSKEMGYDFTEEEHIEALKEYFSGMGVWGAIKTFRHLNKVVKKTEKEMKKNK